MSLFSVCTFVVYLLVCGCVSYCVLNEQVELKLKKAEGWRWEKLENDGCTNTAKQFNPGK